MKTNYRAKEIVDALRAAGLRSGQSVFSHSNIGYFGRMEGAETIDDYANAFVSAFEEVIGPEGTLILPTFSYSFCRREVFDPESTVSTCGSLAEYFRTRGGGHRSLEPNFSVAAKGKLAQFFVADQPKNPFAQGGFFQRLFDQGGQICNLNFDSGATIVHYFERELKVPYRWDKNFPGIMKVHGTEVPGEFEHFVYDLTKPEDEADLTKFHSAALAEGVTKSVHLGRGTINALSAVDAFELVKKHLPLDPYFLRRGTSN